MIVKLYRQIIPATFRECIYDAFLGTFLEHYRKVKERFKGKIYFLYYAVIPPENAKQEAFKDWATVGPSAYPYLWKKEYEDRNYEVNTDKSNGLPYILHNGKKLYFKRDTTSDIPVVYRSLLIEQDLRSAHRYVASYEELKGKTLLDIGAAEAIFTLDTIEYIDHAYLFECEDCWIEAIEATFAPWKDKITVVHKYVSDINDENNVTLDEYFRDKPKDNIFFKMDIDGSERKALKGAVGLLRNEESISGAVCIYHLKDDDSVIQKTLAENGLKTFVQPGFIYFEKEMRSAIMRFCRME